MNLLKYSLGIGDRFGLQGQFQLKALERAYLDGIMISPVWNKSNKEHEIIKSSPIDTRREADNAIEHLNYKLPYFVDADHINLNNVDKFIASSDYFTIDVADFIGKPIDKKLINIFVEENKKYLGNLFVPGIPEPFKITNSMLREIAEKYLYAINEAGKIYFNIAQNKGLEKFISEVSLDEVDTPQTPVELFFILKALANVDLPLQTIAPRFCGKFNKGIDYVGNPTKFAIEFEQALLIIDYAIKEFGLPQNLKLSIHSGSDKFTLYPIIKEVVRKYNKGFHLKTAGTTWLEEVIGLAVSGNDGLEIAKTIYQKSRGRYKEFCANYLSVIDINERNLPSVEEVMKWTGEKFANTLRHIPTHQDFNADFRQFVHISYKIAAEMGSTYTNLIKKHSEIVGKQVYDNLYERHIKLLYY